MKLNSILEPKTKSEINNNVTRLFHLISFKKHDPIVTGSNAVKGFYYAGDYDLFSVVQTEDSIDKLAKILHDEFVKMVDKIKENDDVYFIELLAGSDKEKKALKWTPIDIKKGHVLKDGVKYDFVELFQEESIIKIEIIAYVPSIGFVPMSNAFEFQSTDGTGINHEKLTIDTVDSLKRDVKKFHERNNLMKVLKRLFVIAQVEKNLKLAEKLANIFNSDIGRLYKVKSNLECTKEVVSSYHDKLTMSRAYDEIQKLKEYIGGQTVYKFKQQFYKQFDRVSKTKNPKVMANLLDKLCEEILKVVNKLLKKHIKHERITYKKYLL